MHHYENPYNYIIPFFITQLMPINPRKLPVIPIIPFFITQDFYTHHPLSVSGQP